MTVREFIEACDDKDVAVFSLYNDGLYFLSFTCKKDNESYFNEFLEKYGEKKIKNWHFKSSKYGYVYTIVLVERGYPRERIG